MNSNTVLNQNVSKLFLFYSFTQTRNKHSFLVIARVKINENTYNYKNEMGSKKHMVEIKKKRKEEKQISKYYKYI